MKPLMQADASQFAGIRFILTDMDDTLTYRGRLSAATYAALERLQAAGIKVIPVTAAPAGWCDQMARMWPVDGVIGENGGFFFRRKEDSHDLDRRFWHSPAARPALEVKLAQIGARVLAGVDGAGFADDQIFRQTSLAFKRPDRLETARGISDALREAGADTTINNLWILGWLGGYDKLAMARRVLLDHYAVDIDADSDAVLYVGDSTNDAPMFSFFQHTVGVSTVVQYLDEIADAPRWITVGPGGAGFVEAADAVISARERAGV